MWILEIGMLTLFALFVVNGVSLHRFVARMNKAESTPISMDQAIRATSVFAMSRDIRARRAMVWRHGKVFFVTAVAFQLILLGCAAFILFLVFLKWLYAQA